MPITILHRAPGQDWQLAEFQSNAEAEAFCKALPAGESVSWGGVAEMPDPPLATRAMWTGTIAFGLVSAPVKAFKATEDADAGLHLFCAEHDSRITLRRWCAAGEHEPAEVRRGVETASGRAATVTDAELAELRGGPPKAINVDQFVPARSVPAAYVDQTYYLSPEKGGRRPYDLLAAVLLRTRCVAICQVTMRERVHLAMVRPEAGGRLVLVTLHWPTEVRSDVALPNLEGEARIDPQEFDLARRLVASMRGKAFDRRRYVDPYRSALDRLLDARVEAAEPAGAQGNVLDLMAKLDASVAEAKSRRRKAASS